MPVRNFETAKHLNRGDRFKLNKEELETIEVNLSWDSDADLDACAFLLNEDGVIVEDSDFVYYNSATRCNPDNPAGIAKFDMKVYGSKKKYKEETVPCSSDLSVIGSADDLGGDDAGETMHVVLSRVRPGISSIIFCVSIYGEGTSFKDVKDPKIIITDEDSGNVLCEYDLKVNFSDETAVVAGGLMLNEDGEWEFEAIGNGYDGGLQTLIDMYA